MDREEQKNTPERNDVMGVDDGSAAVDDSSVALDSEDSQAADNAEKLRGELQGKLMQVRMRLEQVKSYAASKGLPEPEIRDEQYLSQDPSSLSAGDLADLDMRMQDIDRDVTGHEASQIQQEAGQAVGMLAALGAIGGAGALAGALFSDEHKDVSAGALGTAEINHGIGAMGQQQQRDRGNALDL